MWVYGLHVCYTKNNNRDRVQIVVTKWHADILPLSENIQLIEAQWHNSVTKIWIIIGMGHHWLGKWLVVWQHQAITRASVD